MSQPGPRFPKLGMKDDRRETYIVPEGGLGHQVKARAIAAQGWAGDRAEAHKMLMDHVAGAVTADANNNTGFALQRPGLNDKYTEATVLHENNHLMFNRVAAKHGDHAANSLARNLLMTMPDADRNATFNFYKQDNPEVANDPKNYHHWEEWMCSMIDYANDPRIRQKHMEATGITPEQQRALHDSVKRGLRHVHRAAAIADAKWLIRKRSFLGLQQALAKRATKRA